MNNSKSNSPIRLIAFFLVALLLVCTFGFTADGWLDKDGDAGTPGESDENAENGGTNTDDALTDKPQDDEQKDDEPVVHIPEFTNPLTGVESNEEISKMFPTAFVIDSASPLYGVSESDILAELPTEDGKTRLVSITTDLSRLWKIGSLTQTRGYISNLAKYFSSSLVSVGCDDKVSYDSIQVDWHFDLSQNIGHHYTEYTDYNYTNGDLIRAGLANTGIQPSSPVKLPFNFNDFTNDELYGSAKAHSVTIPFSQSSRTELSYSESDGMYSITKSGTQGAVSSSRDFAKFKNCFVLFANSVTYESLSGVQTVMNTLGEGYGLYFTNGTVTQISWTANASGELIFYTSDSVKLVVNRGTSYIAYMKSSRSEEVKFS